MIDGVVAAMIDGLHGLLGLLGRRGRTVDGGARHRAGGDRELSESLLARFEATEAGWIWETDERGRFAGDLSGVARALGVTPDRVRGGPFGDLVGTGRPGAVVLIEALAACRAFGPVVVEVRRADGEPRSWEVAGQPSFHPVEGTYLGHRGIGIDLGAHQQERLLQQREDLIESIAIGAAGLVHDINGLLQTALGNIELCILAEGGVEPLGRTASSDPLRDSVTAIKQAADMAAQLVTSGRQPTLSPEPARLSQLVWEALDLAPPQLELLVEIDPEATVLVDRELLLRSLDNLLRNAQETAGDTVRRVLIRGERVPDGGARLTIGDDGPGFPPGQRDRVLEPFFTTRQGEGGCGLGLSVVNGFVRRSGGRLELGRSELGGAEVVIVLPAARASASLTDSDRRPTRLVRGAPRDHWTGGGQDGPASASRSRGQPNPGKLTAGSRSICSTSATSQVR